MGYAVKEVFYSLQGEGVHSGRPAIFCRLSNCNLWTGREADRPQAICQFCDTDFIGTDGQNGGRFQSAEDLAQHLHHFWPNHTTQPPFVVLTGGEPLLQVDENLVKALHTLNFEIAIETNGTKTPPEGIDWICMSPKAHAPLILDRGDELKLVYPQPDLLPEKVCDLEYTHFFIQPMDDPNPAIHRKNIKDAIQYCLENPQWQLSLQTHKMLGID